MELEFHQLDLRYESLRRRAPDRESRLLASLAEGGQRTPIVVVAETSGARVVVDGYKRVRALKKLRADSVVATEWQLNEPEALILEWLMRCSGEHDAFGEGWLLRELQLRFDLSGKDLAKDFGKSDSWVSRRISLVAELPEEIQECVRRGEIGPHAAMKFLVPLARANRIDCLRLVASLSRKKVSSRQMESLYRGWVSGTERSRELLLSNPWLFLRAQAEARNKAAAELPVKKLLAALARLEGIYRESSLRIHEGCLHDTLPTDHHDIWISAGRVQVEADGFFDLLGKELDDARPVAADSHSRTSQEGK